MPNARPLGSRLILQFWEQRHEGPEKLVLSSSAQAGTAKRRQSGNEVELGASAVWGPSGGSFGHIVGPRHGVAIRRSWSLESEQFRPGAWTGTRAPS